MEVVMKLNINEFLKRFNENYDFLYENRDAVAGYSEALEFGDEFIMNDNNISFIGEFNRFRCDILSSDREVVAFAFTLSDFDAI